MKMHPALLSRRPLAIVGATLVVAAVVTATSVSAVAAQASELSEAQARTVSIEQNAHHVGLGGTTLDLTVSRTAGMRSIASDELASAATALASGAGRASTTALDGLGAAASGLTRALDRATFSLDLVFTLREAEKTVTEQAAAWQAAEDARLAAEAAAAAAAAAAAQAAASAAAAAAADDDSDSWSGESGDAGSDTPTSAGPVPPTGCGPCPGATLVQVNVDGAVYWACP